MKVQYVKIKDAEGNEEMYIKESTIKKLIHEYQISLDNLPNLKDVTERVDGIAYTLELVLKDLKALIST